MKEKISFTDRVVLVSGGSSGIGRAIALEFAKEGADVAIADIDLEGGRRVVERIRNEHDREANVYETDVSNYGACENTVENVLKEMGRIDALMNVAAGETGDLAEMTQPFVEETPEEWEPQLQITFKGTLNLTHCVLPTFIENERGVVINFSSDSYQGQDPDLTVYAAAKAGIVTFTKSLAKEVGEHGVRVNAISPSTTRTPATEDWLDEYGDRVVKGYPLGRLGKPEDHAEAAVFLASDAAGWITGQTISVNGGFL